LYQEETPCDIFEKKEFLLRHNIAVWDVIASCDIIGSSDSSIKNVLPTNIMKILMESDIHKIYTNGKLAGKLYQKYQKQNTKILHYELPSTSPANAAYSLEKLLEEWKAVK
jgi:hypoxanthine-DNA glycosylase